MKDSSLLAAPLPRSPPILRYKEGTTVGPGDRIGTIRQVRAGMGTYVKGGHIYACLLGTLRLILLEQEDQTPVTRNEDGEDNNPSEEERPTPLYICTVAPSQLPASSQVLKVGQRVVGRVSRITPQNALVEIRVAEGVGPLQQPYQYEGAIRIEDVRSAKNSTVDDQAKRSVVLADCFRPGDLVACRVISMGDTRRYFLSTAETELGVLRAERNGVVMTPISWKEMECPETGKREARKCAKPLQLLQKNE